MSTAFIIGASRGIGLEWVRQLRARHWRVIATARDQDGLSTLEALGAEAIRLDVSDAESLATLAWKLDGEKLDLTVYVAGVLGPREGAVRSPSQHDFDHVMHTNVLGAMQLMPQILPMVGAARGTFAVVSSQLASLTSADSATPWLYRASKAALNMVIRAAAHDYPLARLLALSPGWVRTDMGGDAAPLTVEQSVLGMLEALEGPWASGSFVNYQGQNVPW